MANARSNAPRSSIKKSPILSRIKNVGFTRSIGPTPAMTKLSFTLHIRTTNTSPQRGTLQNRFEEPDSEIISMHAGPLARYDRSTERHHELTEDEKREVGFRGKTLPLESVWIAPDPRRPDRTIATRRTYTNTKGYFTIAEVVNIIEKFERLDRPKTRWFGGIDCHHTYFDGMCPNTKNDAFRILWGS